MPKRYSDREKEYIKERLKKEAANCLAQYGIRRTTVDELVKRVKIPKGTFYLFYPSKEMLLFEVILQFHEDIEQSLLNAISQLDPETLTADQLTDVLFQFYKQAEETPVLKMISSDEIELLARKLPPELVEAHLVSDLSTVETVLAALPTKPGMDSAAVSAAFRAIYFSTLHREDIGEEKYDDGLRFLIRGLIMQLL